MNTEKQVLGEVRGLFFPEIIGVSILALLLPLPLLHLLLSGHVLASIAGFALWFVALFFAVRFIRRRQYGFAYFPMLAWWVFISSSETVFIDTHTILVTDTRRSGMRKFTTALTIRMAMRLVVVLGWRRFCIHSWAPGGPSAAGETAVTR